MLVDVGGADYRRLNEDDMGGMLTFRIICAVLMAWAVNWVMSRPEAVPLLTVLPIMATIGPLAAGVVGFVNLASRQGWGVVVAVANGVWAGLLAIVVSGVFYMIFIVGEAVLKGYIRDFGTFMRVSSTEIEPLFELVVNVPLIILTITATSVLGVFSEFLHWALVRMRRNRDPMDEYS
ncbi:MAG: hypothetical protein AAFP23_07325 [Pseudomonadota bacterium]